jgi:hypothetical protein
VSRTCAADDFATIKARLEELRRKRERAERAEKGLIKSRNRTDPFAIAVRRLRDATGYV